ncbi:RNA ligase [Allocatelliglobosispora scoriae]|uniref:RNA ligase n=1 Tax=Allocatelliglobosispora scoriae TaxID=643052 RepID=A0A841BWH4_9ACTN|nr:RNA ligase [Allocatelliglobosispora scoriae]MBB5872025.1 RNA ligase [Allocatelliglobosispora scoriae]
MAPPVITLTDLFDPARLASHVANGYVRTQVHPTLPLTIYNYTEKAQYEKVWDEITLSCRGLIAETATGRVLARPYAKFFNHSEPGAPVAELSAPVRVTDKADGSLGIIYATTEGLAVATRGSFASDQARHATDLLRRRYATWAPPPGHTVLVEIIYPANRIVLDYGGMDDLMLLGAVELATGRSLDASAVTDWPGPRVETFAYATFAEALAAPPRQGREGLVVWFPDSDQRVKIKYADYVAMHRIVTGLNARVVWELLAAGEPLDSLIEELPDEFHTWVAEVAAALREEVAARVVEIEAAYEAVVTGLPEGWGRKEFALAVGKHEQRGSLFLRLDGRSYEPYLWQQIRPAPDWTPAGRVYTE